MLFFNPISRRDYSMQTTIRYLESMMTAMSLPAEGRRSNSWLTNGIEWRNTQYDITYEYKLRCKYQSPKQASPQRIPRESVRECGVQDRNVPRVEATSSFKKPLKISFYHILNHPTIAKFLPLPLFSEL